LLIPQPHNYPNLRSIEAIGLNEQFSGVNDRKRMWRMGQEALKEGKRASLTDDFPLSQGPKADQWKGDL